MSKAATLRWPEQNQANLLAHMARLRHALEQYAGQASGAYEEAPLPAMTASPAIDVLCQMFSLDTFSRDVLLLCAGVELDGPFSVACARAQGSNATAPPTFGLALGALAGGNWGALSPQAPLRFWRLLDVAPGPSLTQAALRIDERVLHFLTGVDCMDDWIDSLVLELASKGKPAPSHIAIAEQVLAAWDDNHKVLQLVGPDTDSKREVAIAACAMRGNSAYLIDSAGLPSSPADLTRFMRLWEREWILGSRILLLDTDDDGPAGDGDRAQRHVADHLIRHLNCPLIVLGVQRRRTHGEQILGFEIGKPSLDEQQRLWRHALGKDAAALKTTLPALAFQFNLSAPDIVSACAQAKLQKRAGDKPAVLAERLWHSCRMQARLRLDELVQRIEPRADWDDLVLPGAQRQVLGDILIQVRQRPAVYQQWGFAGQGTRGLGLVALFAGSSGTGKTMAAEVLARKLRLDLYRVDLSAVVSKYIGETEKNLRLVFDAAEAGGAILLFDEADALFGKRTEVKDSHDRHANIEVSYLLQRMEAYPGLAILTSNLKESLDTAFLRRLRFIVQFPFPDFQQRGEIWRRAFPIATPLADIDYERLARLNIAGGNIRNVALHAAFLAAEDKRPLDMGHLLAGVRNEYEKLERSLTASEIGDWV